MVVSGTHLIWFDGPKFFLWKESIMFIKVFFGTGLAIGVICFLFWGAYQGFLRKDGPIEIALLFAATITCVYFLSLLFQ